MMTPPTNENERAKIRITDKTLAAQLQITEREIDFRKSLLNLTEEDVDHLKSCREHIGANVDQIVDRFYDQQLEISEIALLIGDAETLQRLRSFMRSYTLELFDGHYDAEYVNKRLRIGKVHKRIGVSPKLYIAAITSLEYQIDLDIKSDPALASDSEAVAATRAALHKLLMFDVQLVFDTYISSLVAEVESAKGELEGYALSLEEIIEDRTRQLREQSTRDVLTGLLNRRAFDEQLRRELAVANRTRESLALIYIDLDDFKKLNDEKGHKAGDRLLTCFGEVLLEATREGDIPCRVGGDEFCVILPRSDPRTAEVVFARIVDAFKSVAPAGTSFSVGIAASDGESNTDADGLIWRADALMYEAKRQHRSDGEIKVRIESEPAAELLRAS